MKIINHLDKKKVGVDFDEFKTMIMENHIGPYDLIKDNILTENEWLAAENLRIIHRLSPVNHAKGSVLLEKMSMDEKKEAGEKNWESKFSSNKKLPWLFWELSSLFQHLPAS